MSLSEALIPEFDQEMAGTRKVLERIPPDKLDWRAHEKSNSIGWVGMHLAEIPGWTESVLKEDCFDVDPPGGEPYRVADYSSVTQILEVFDIGVASARAALATTSDDAFAEPWSLLEGGKALLTLPRAVTFRSFIMNHSIHHRAHLCVYLRLNDVPVPSLYGGSADEPGL